MLVHHHSRKPDSTFRDHALVDRGRIALVLFALVGKPIGSRSGRLFLGVRALACAGIRSLSSLSRLGAVHFGDNHGRQRARRILGGPWFFSPPLASRSHSTTSFGYITTLGDTAISTGTFIFRKTAKSRPKVTQLLRKACHGPDGFCAALYRRQAFYTRRHRSRRGSARERIALQDRHRWCGFGRHWNNVAHRPMIDVAVHAFSAVTGGKKPAISLLMTSWRSLTSPYMTYMWP